MNDAVPVAQPPIKFSLTDAALAELADKYKEPTVPTTPGEYDALKADIKVVRDVRIAVDGERRLQTAAALAHQRAVNAEGNRIIDALVAIEQPMKDCKATVDEAEERKVREAEEIERQRITTIEDRIRRIESLGQIGLNTTLEAIESRMTLIDNLDPGDGTFDEFAKRAADAKQHVRNDLITAKERLQQAAKEQAELDEKREALEAEQKKQKEESDRLAAEREAFDKEKREKEEADADAERVRVEQLEAAAIEEQTRKDKMADAERKKQLAPDRDKLNTLAGNIRGLAVIQFSSPIAQQIADDVYVKLDTLATETEMLAMQL